MTKRSVLPIERSIPLSTREAELIRVALQLLYDKARLDRLRLRDPEERRQAQSAIVEITALHVRFAAHFDASVIEGER